MTIQIDKYQLAYHPTQGCRYRIFGRGLASWGPWMTVTAADLAAVAAVLNESPVYYSQESGMIFTGEEPTGGT